MERLHNRDEHMRSQRVSMTATLAQISKIIAPYDTGKQVGRYDELSTSFEKDGCRHRRGWMAGYESIRFLSDSFLAAYTPT
jgi:hypothetical protein